MEYASGNGSVMQTWPIGVALLRECEIARKKARGNSQITHPALGCREACETYTEHVCLA